MKSIVLACKNISEEVEEYVANSHSITDQDQDRVSDLKSKMSVSLTELMNAARHFATHFGKTNTSTIEIPVQQLSVIVYDLINMVPTDNQNDDNALSVDELKVFLPLIDMVNVIGTLGNTN